MAHDRSRAEALIGNPGDLPDATRPPDGSDGLLLTRYAATGDQAAFDELVRRHHDLVLRICTRVLPQRSPDVEDAVQETFIKLARAAGEVDGNLTAWLRATARTTAIDRWRRQSLRNQREREAGGLAPQRAEPPRPRCERDDDLHVVRQCLDELARRDREVVESYFLHGQTQSQIARRIGVSQVAVQQRLSSSLTALRRRCVRRGLSGAALTALLAARASGADSPAAAISADGPPTSSWRPWIGGTLAAAACAIGFVLVRPNAAPVPMPRPVAAPTAMAAADVASDLPEPATGTAWLVPALDDSGAWQCRGTAARALELHGRDGRTCRVLRLSTSGPGAGIASFAVASLPAAFAVTFQYRPLLPSAAASIVGAGLHFPHDAQAAYLDPRLSEQKREWFAPDRWHQGRMEVRSRSCYTVRATMDGQPAGEVSIGALLPPDQIQFRLIEQDLELADVRIVELPSASSP